MVRIEIIPAPQPVQDRIAMRKACGYKTYIVIDEEAFKVIFDEKMNAAQQQYLELRDPMYYVDMGNFTIIIGQYGPFPSEQEIVSFVQTQYPLLKEQNHDVGLN